MTVNNMMQLIAVITLPLIFAITLHEAAHGWIASKLGDKTALMLGRVSLNPIKHIDPIGTIVLPFLMLLFGGFIFGWAKPVPVSWQNLNNPRRDMAFVAIAGPAANLLMALIWAAIGKLALILLSGDYHPLVITTTKFIHYMTLYGVMINVFLMILNLIPIPPLDGSRVVSSLLPPNAARVYESLEPFGIWILLGFILIVWKFYPQLLLGPVRYLVKVINTIFGIS